MAQRIFTDDSLQTFVDEIKSYTDTAVSDKADTSHSHSNATQSAAGFMSAEDKTQLDLGGIPIVTTAGDGSAYTATVDGITALTVGTKITIIPHVVSAAYAPTLNVNGLGAKAIRMPVTYNSASTANGAVTTWLAANRPVTVEYNGTYWLTISLQRPSANGLSGTVQIANGGTGATTAEDACSNIGALPLTGGVLSGNTGVEKTDSTVTSIYVQNVVDETERKLSLHASSAGNTGLYDYTFAKWLAYMTPEGNGLLNGGLYCKNVTTTGEDLDNYTNSGVYYFSSSYTPTNIPAGVNGILIVQGGSMTKQIWMRQGTIGTNDYQMWVRTKVSTWSSWSRLMTEHDAPVYTGSATRGCIKFPTVKIQICWERRTFSNITCTNAWEGGYESGVLNFQNWYSAFNAVPVASKILTGSNYSCISMPHGAVTATAPGSIYLFRPQSEPTATTLYGMAIGIGTYA